MLNKLFKFLKIESVSRIFFFIKNKRKILFVLFTLILILSFTELLPPLFTKYLIDDVYVFKDMALLNKVIIGLLILNVIGNLLGFLGAFVDIYINTRVPFEIRLFIFKLFQKFSLRFFQNYQTGEVVHRIMQDSDSIQHLLLNIVLPVGMNLFTFISALIISLILDWKLTAFILLLVPFNILNIIIFTGKIEKSNKRLGEHYAVAYSSLYESYNANGIRTIKAFNLKYEQIKTFCKNLRFIFDENTKLGLLHTFTGIVAGIISHFGWIIILWYGGFRVFQGDFTIGTIWVFTSYFSRLYSPFDSLLKNYQGLRGSIPAANRIIKLFDNHMIDAPTGSRLLQNVKGTIEFKDVWFGYHENEYVVKDINFLAEANQKIALVGSSGAGKTTIISLLLRFFDINRGTILFDNIDIREIQVKSLRDKISVVLQHPFLFHDTIINNIRLSNPNSTMEEVIHATKIANIYDVIMKTKDQFNTVVSEGGSNFSGGEQQRLCIARAILKDPKILVLDEATSNVDSESEALIQDAMDKIILNRTTFIIAHRLSTVINADNILVFDNHTIAEQGKHSELLKKNGVYNKLYNYQFNRKLKDDNDVHASSF